MTNKNEQRKVPELRFPEFSGEWEENKLSDSIQLLKSGLSRQLSNEDIGYPVIRANNLQNGKLDLTDLKFWFKDDPQGANTENYFVEKNDILINFINSESKMGTSCIINEPLYRKMIYTTNILRYVTKKGFHPYFHYTYTFTSNYKKWIKIITKPAVNQASFTTVDFKNIPYLVPSFNEQQKIGEFFSKLDRQIELEEKKLALLEEQKKGYMQKIFSQELRFKDENGEEYPEWEEDYLKNLFSIKSSGDLNQSDLSRICQNEHVYPVYGNALTNEGLLGFYSTYMFDEDSLTVTGRGEVGIPIYRNKKFNAAGRLLVLNNKSHIYSLFYLYVLRNTHFYNETTGVPQLTAPTLGQYKVIKPIYNEQQKIGLFLNKIDEKKYLLEKKIKHLLARKNCLLGKIII